MPDYTPPLQDMLFMLEHVIGLDNLPEHPDLGRLDIETIASILEPAAALASDVLAPLNHSGDRAGVTLKDGAVTTAPGFKAAYRQYCEGGWNAVPFDPAHGGQGLPWLVAFAVQEMWQGANMAFGLCPLLNQGAVEAIAAHGSDAQKDAYLEKLISGEWTGTMNLTEPQAGSDLAAIRSRAEVAEHSTYKIFGQKIYITYGEHDFTDNIIHLVLARIPGAPEGVKGISLFVAPKFLGNGTRNDVICTGIEHKLGIHASPTCTMQFEGATGTLIGEAGQGLKYMFTMMNNARLSVGLQGVAIAEASYQKALAYAQERVQGANKTIAEHADVKRMLLSMTAQIQAGRAMTYEAALALTKAQNGDLNAQARVDLLTPLVKSWCTDMAVNVTSIGVQIHGGMGFIEETGAAQFYRDARILPIYEGTNGIQAADLVFRKIVRDGGVALQALLAEFLPLVDRLREAGGDDLAVIAEGLADCYTEVLTANDKILALAKQDADLAAAVSVPYLNAVAEAVAGMMLGRGALAAQDLLAERGQDHNFLEAKLLAARFFAETYLPQVAVQAKTVPLSAKTVVSAKF